MTCPNTRKLTRRNVSWLTGIQMNCRRLLMNPVSPPPTPPCDVSSQYDGSLAAILNWLDFCAGA
jgi:hypothetical protein